MADLTPARLAELRRICSEVCSAPGCGCTEHLAAAVPTLLDEIDRLRAVIRETHAPCVRVQNNYRTEHMVHQPGCKLYEIEP